MFIESGQSIPELWKKWAEEHGCNRSNPFLVIEADYKLAAEELLDFAVRESLLPLKMDNLTVLLLFSNDPSAYQRADVYHSFFRGLLNNRPQHGIVKDEKIGEKITVTNSISFFRFNLEYFSEKAVKDVYRKNSDVFEKAMTAEYAVFFCGNDEIAKGVDEIIDHYSLCDIYNSLHVNNVNKMRSYSRIVFGFDNSISKKQTKDNSVHIITAEPDLEEMLEKVEVYLPKEEPTNEKPPEPFSVIYPPRIL
jgi:hypothetical protein